MEHQQRYREKHMSDSNARGMGYIFSNRRDERMTEKIEDYMHPTMLLRFVDREAGPGHVRVLQQAFRNSSAGELEWRDVSVTEEN